MEQIALPSKIEFIAGSTKRSGSIVVEPLFPGYGTTLGNSLRRVMLSSLTGAAVTAVKITNAPHEFTTLPKIQEDLLQIMLNLKLLRFRVASDEPVSLTLKAKGEKLVTAGDITPDSRVEIVSPELPIATLTSRTSEIEMTLTVAKGRGYVPTEAREKEKLDIGTIAIDAFFSPVRRVAFRVDPARVGQMTNFDKLILEIETDGTITPVEAVTAALDILVEQFSAVTAALKNQSSGQEAVPVLIETNEALPDLVTIPIDQENVVLEENDNKITKKKRASRKKAE